jgi:hypothetical protein
VFSLKIECVLYMLCGYSFDTHKVDGRALGVSPPVELGKLGGRQVLIQDEASWDSWTYSLDFGQERKNENEKNF